MYWLAVEVVEMKSSNLVVKVNLRDRRTEQAPVVKAKDSELDSEHNTETKVDEK